MTSGMAVRSESWLDLSQISEMAERRNRRSVQQSSTRRSSSSLVEQRQNSIPSVHLAAGKQSGKNEHLLIRLRQRSYLNRSSSTTLSSNLSNSIELNQELDDDGQASEGAENVTELDCNQQHQRRDLSFGLRSFRNRFERRFQQRANGRNERASSRERSPFARSWSSLSEQFSSGMNHIGHSWKSFLYSCKHRDEPEGCQSHLQAPDNDRGRSSRQSDRLAAPPAACLEADQAELDHVRRRLTADWISRHSNLACAPSAGSPRPPPTRTQVDRERVQMRRRLRNQDDKIRPRSIQLPCAEFVHQFKKLGAFDEEQDDSDHEARLAELERRLARSQSQQPQTECHISGRFVGQSARSSTTNTSATLVSESQLISKREPNDSAARVKQRAQTCSPAREVASRLLSEYHDHDSIERAQQFNIAAQATSKDLNQTLKLLSPQVATSDYWSSSALTNTSATSGRITEPASMRRQQHQQHQQRRPQSQRLSDDYYLEVAAAGGQLKSQQEQRQHQMELMKQQEPAMFAPALAQQQMQANYQQWQQQQQQHYKVDQRAAQSVFQSAEELEGDYDDYAVPADESCCRLERSQVELVQLIGEGQKGYVFLGKLQSRNGQQIIDVAIKTLKYETEALIERLMSEAAMMKQLEHPHIIRFIGMCPETPALIAMELAKLGELKQYLKLYRNSLKTSQLVLFAFQISTALSYLESKNYVHRDVAARNVLVCSHSCVKLADFGLSRNLQPSLQQLQLLQTGTDEHKQGSLSPDDTQQLYVAAPRVKLPVRWLAPESLVFRRFTSASDVWMFAVCTWELFQLGLLRPWPHLRNNQVLLAIESGQRLARPDVCPQRLYQVLLKCWSYAPVQRPKFREIKQSIWSIYLSERTCEQLELEEFEAEKRRFQLISAKPQQQQQEQQQIPILTSQLQKQQRPSSLSPLVSTSGAGGGQFVIGGSGPRAMLANYAASNYSSNTMTTNTTNTTDNDERSTSPGSSTFGSMARNQRVPPEAGRRAAADSACPATFAIEAAHEAALRAQMSRFQQRQAAAEGNFRRAHVLQKQRSQGAIGLASEERRADFDGFDRRASQKLSASERERQRRMQPADDGALEYDARRTKRRLYAMALRGIECDDEPAEEPTGERTHFEAQQQRALNQQRLLKSARGEQQERRLEPADWRPESAFAPSVSPALTVDHTADNSRVASLDPQGVEREVRLVECRLSPQQPQRLSNGKQVAMLRAKYDANSAAAADLLARRTTSQSPASFRLNSVGPALTPVQTDSRPGSWRSDERQQEPEMMVKQNWPQPSQQSARPVKPVDQLGQMLQALRITPMKAKLKSPAEQTVRVLHRQDESPSPARQLIEQVQVANYANYENQRARNGPVGGQVAEEKPNKLLLHQRLLGRIRSPSNNNSSSNNNNNNNNNQNQAASHELPLDGAVRSARKARLAQQKSVETVDQSLQLLESLIQNGERGQQAASASLPRRPKEQTRR